MTEQTRHLDVECPIFCPNNFTPSLDDEEEFPGEVRAVRLSPACGFPSPSVRSTPVAAVNDDDANSCGDEA